MVVKVRIGLVRLPYVALDVVIQSTRRTREGPKVWIRHLMGGGGPEVLDPLGIEYALDVHDAILLQRPNLRFAEFVPFGGGDAGCYPVGEGKTRVLKSKVIFPQCGLL